jgi:hypothetical protein
MSDDYSIYAAPINRRTEREMGEDYIKYVQECNAKVKETGNTDFKAIPEFAWERKQLKS